MISRRREAQFLRKTVQKPWRKTKRGLPSWIAALTAQMPTAFAEQLAAPAKNHRAEIQWKGEERHATKFLGERFRNHGERPNGVTFVSSGTHSATESILRGTTGRSRDAANIYVQVYVLGDPIPTLWPRRDLVF